MSYLMAMTESMARLSRAEKELGVVSRWHVQWRSVKGTVSLTLGDVSDQPRIYYVRYSKLGERLRRNDESERVYIAREMNKLCGMPSDHTYAFVGV